MYIVCLVFIYAIPRFPFFVVLFSLIYCINKNLSCINTTSFCCSKICQQFHFFNHTYSENEMLLSFAVACGPATQQDLKIQGIQTCNGDCLCELPQYFFHTLERSDRAYTHGHILPHRRNWLFPIGVLFSRLWNLDKKCSGVAC